MDIYEHIWQYRMQCRAAASKSTLMLHYAEMTVDRMLLFSLGMKASEKSISPHPSLNGVIYDGYSPFRKSVYDYCNSKQIVTSCENERLILNVEKLNAVAKAKEYKEVLVKFDSSKDLAIIVCTGSKFNMQTNRYKLKDIKSLLSSLFDSGVADVSAFQMLWDGLGEMASAVGRAADRIIASPSDP